MGSGVKCSILSLNLCVFYTNTVTVTSNLKNKGFEDQFGTNQYNNIPKKLDGETSTQTQVLPDSFWSGGTLAFSKLMSQNGSTTLLPLKRSVAICSGNITNYLQPSSYGYHHLLSSVKCSIQTLGLRCTVATRSNSGEVSEHQTASTPFFFFKCSATSAQVTSGCTPIGGWLWPEADPCPAEHTIDHRGTQPLLPWKMMHPAANPVPK